MIYELSMTIPAGTAEAVKTTAVKKVWGGVIHYIHIIIPPGCRDMVKVQLFQGGHQFAPSTHGQSFHGDGTEIKYQEYYELDRGWNEIEMRGWSAGTKYDHTVTAYIAVLKADAINPWLAFRDIEKALRELLAKIGVEV